LEFVTGIITFDNFDYLIYGLWLNHSPRELGVSGLDLDLANVGNRRSNPLDRWHPALAALSPESQTSTTKNQPDKKPGSGSHDMAKLKSSGMSYFAIGNIHTQRRLPVLCAG
jgi:hypothetical protein